MCVAKDDEKDESNDSDLSEADSDNCYATQEREENNMCDDDEEEEEEEEEEESAEEEEMCGLCNTSPKEALFQCGHGVCMNCAELLKICYSCRKKVKKVLKL